MRNLGAWASWRNIICSSQAFKLYWLSSVNLSLSLSLSLSLITRLDVLIYLLDCPVDGGAAQVPEREAETVQAIRRRLPQRPGGHKRSVMVVGFLPVGVAASISIINIFPHYP